MKSVTNPKEKRMQRELKRVTHMIRHLHLGIGFSLSSQPWRAQTVATYPTIKLNPNKTSLNAAIGKHTKIFTHSYTPSILGVLFLKGSTVVGPGTSNRWAPRNPYGFSPKSKLKSWLSSLLMGGWDGWSWMVRTEWGQFEDRSGAESWFWSDMGCGRRRRRLLKAEEERIKRWKRVDYILRQRCGMCG